MLFKKDDKKRIVSGAMTATLRSWKRCQAKVGGQYNIPPYGAIEVTEIHETPLESVEVETLACAGYPSPDAAAARLKVPATASVYVVVFRYLGKDPVKQPDTGEAGNDDLADIMARLQRMDAQASWTRATLELIAENPGTRAGDLAPNVNQDLATFKRNVRKLKALGLTESLETGYRLSARGRQLLKKEMS